MQHSKKQKSDLLDLSNMKLSHIYPIFSISTIYWLWTVETIQGRKLLPQIKYVDFCTTILLPLIHHHRKSTTDLTLLRSYKPFVFVHINEYHLIGGHLKKTIKDLWLISFSKYTQWVEINFKVSFHLYFHDIFMKS